ncbi:MAG: VOC family protein [Actinomycetota bacterium]|nr:VOC family protein [Actinomycetota bacterium]
MTEPKSFDHVALWVEDYEGLSSFLCEALGVHQIEAGEDFHLVGANAREGKLTLFGADGPRQPGVLRRVVLRVEDLAAAQAGLPEEVAVTIEEDGISFEAPGGLGIGLMKGGGLDLDLDHVLIRVPQPEVTAAAFEDFGFRRDGETRVVVGDRSVRLERGDPGTADRPLLNHLALLVDSADDAKEEAEGRGQTIEKTVDAENTIAVFVSGPDGITIEYVEHKPSFSLV